MGAAATVAAEGIPVDGTNLLSILGLHLEESFKVDLMLTLLDANADDGLMRSARNQDSMIAYLPQSLTVKAGLGEGFLFFPNMYGCQEAQSSFLWTLPSGAEDQFGFLTPLPL